MRYRLLVNLPGKGPKAGAIVTADDLGGEFARLDAQDFLEVYVDELTGVDVFSTALEAYRRHMEAAPPLIIAVLDVTETDDQVLAFADMLFKISSTVPRAIQEVMAEVFDRARELAKADPENIPASAFASLFTAAAEGAASMDAAPDHNAPAVDEIADALKGFGERFASLPLHQVDGPELSLITNPEGGAVAAAIVVTTSEAQVVASPDGAAAAIAASNAQAKPAKRGRS